MLRSVSILLLCGALTGSARGRGQPAGAQPAPVKGVVWQAPANTEQAAAELLAMHRQGVEAVRTGLLQQERLFDLADTLGLQFFQELPLDGLSAAALIDTLGHVRRLLDGAVARARNHTSARHFGLARRSDTSDPRACAFFEDLADRVHRAPNSQVYYLSAFVEADQCAGAVDFVLLDARDASDPAGQLARWQAAHTAPSTRRAGIGALGAWVDASASPGLRPPHSPEAQARSLESSLRRLLADTTASSARAVFVYRWRDARSATPSPSRDLAQPYQQNYGLYTAGGAPRPARDVVQGFYSGTQTVFAFPTGEAPAPEIPWSLVFGWLVFILMATSYARSPRFRYMVPRYFLAHGFYREAIREGREVLLGVSVVLLVVVALGAGVFGSVFLEVVRHEAAFALLFRVLPEPAQLVGVALLAQPWTLVLLLGSFYALDLALWTTLLSFASRRRQPLIPGQALMLVLWARWPFPLLMVGAMVAPTLSEALALPLMLVLAGGWILATLSAIVRTLRDYAAATYSPVFLIVVMGVANPLLLLVLGSLFVTLVTLDIGPALRFFWHLATRS